VVVASQAKKGSAVQGAALKEPAVVGHRQQQQLEEKKKTVAPVPCTQRWRLACAFACGDGSGGAFRLRCQSWRELEY
jgi:hypothetical protein